MTTSLPNPDDPDLDANNRNAYELLKNLLKDYGIESLAPAVLTLLQKGYQQDTVVVMLQETKEYKQRFAANDARIAKGLSVLTPAEYIAQERAYRQVLESYGMPKGFYDQQSDFTQWLSDDVSVNEINERSQAAAQAVSSSDPYYLEGLRKMGLGEGDIIASMLDRSRALPILQKVIKTSQIAAEAYRNKIDITKARAEYFSGLGVTQEQARQAYQMISDVGDTAGKLGEIYGEKYGKEDLEDEVLGGSGLASQKRKRLAGREAGQFGGSGAGVRSTTRETKGSF